MASCLVVGGAHVQSASLHSDEGIFIRSRLFAEECAFPYGFRGACRCARLFEFLERCGEAAGEPAARGHWDFREKTTGFAICSPGGGPQAGKRKEPVLEESQCDSVEPGSRQDGTEGRSDQALDSTHLRILCQCLSLRCSPDFDKEPLNLMKVNTRKCVDAQNDGRP